MPSTTTSIEDVVSDEVLESTDQGSASTDSEAMEEEEGEGAGGQPTAASASAAAVITITNPHVCEATRARLLHRKRPCLLASSSSANPALLLLESDEVTSSTKSCSVATSESLGTSSGSDDAAGVGGGGDLSPGVAAYQAARSCASAATFSSTSSAIQGVDKLPNPPEGDEEEKLARMMEACKTILLCMGEDPSRNGLVKTPERWAKALLYMTSGYQMSPIQVTNGAVFEENHDEMVVVRNMNIHSLCEHHMLPFTGVVHVGYIPNGKIVGLSKLARIAELYARRLQVQERLTRQIADAVVEMVGPLGVAVVVECTHFCMVMRGVQQASAVTTTSSVRGCFESNPKTRAEFFSILHNGRVKMC